MTPYLVHHFVETVAQRTPEQEFLVEQRDRHTYAQVDANANRLAHLLIYLGLQRGARVGLLANNSELYVRAYYAILKAGGVVVPVNTAADATSLVHLVEDCGAEFLLAGPRTERLLAAAIPQVSNLRMLLVPDPSRLNSTPSAIRVVSFDEADTMPGHAPEKCLVDQDLALIIYTSGSTGRPRGATLSHLNLVSNIRSIVSYLGLTAADRVLSVLPLYYVYGKSLLNTHACVGGTVVFEDRFLYPNVALDSLERERCTGFSGVPSTFAILLNRSNLANRKLEHLRYVTQAGGAMSPSLTRRLMEVLTRQEIFIMYGATEASARLSYLHPEMLPQAVGSIGRAIPNVELKVLRPDGTEADTDEMGELVARGSNIMRGYWGDEEETSKALDDHGFHTGDLARRDSKGLIYIVGRSKDMIKAGAHRIAAKEIEDAILEHASVHEAAVIGVPDEILGEKILAVVVPRDQMDLDAKVLTKYLHTQLPPYKVPGMIEIRNDLPKNGSGKVMKQVLRAQMADRCGPGSQPLAT